MKGFLRRSVRTRIPNSINTNLHIDELLEQRIQKHESRIKGKLQNNKIVYLISDRVRMQNVRTKDFLLKGTVVGLRETDDQKVLSYNILTDHGYETTRHRRFLRPLHMRKSLKNVNKMQGAMSME